MRATFHAGDVGVWIDCRRDEALRKAGVYRRRPKDGTLVDDLWVDVELHDLGDAIEVENVRTHQRFGRVNREDLERVQVAMRSFAARVRGEVRFFGSVTGDVIWSPVVEENVPSVSAWLRLSDPVGIGWEEEG